MRRQRWILAVAGGAALALVLTAGLGVPSGARQVEAAEEKADAAVERTREQVQMLDVLYKNTVVAVNEMYKNPPAIKVAQRVFGAMAKEGWHEVRLVDVTGAPLDEENAPKTEFEKNAAKAIADGKPYFDQVVGEGKERRLLAATVVPAVHERCAVCHGVEKGDLLGFISYDVPVK